MNRQGSAIPLGRIFGIPIGLDLSWFLIFGLLSWSLATNYYPARFADWSTGLYWGMGALTTILLFGSVLLHELGHALAAMAFGVPVRRIRLMIFGGVAELGKESPSAASEFTIAVAGPIVSLLVALVTGVGWLALQLAGGILEPLLALLGYLAFINLLLAVFNMIPGFPLDGGRVLRAAIWGLTGSMGRATRIAGGIGRLVAFGFMGLGVFQVLTGNLVGGLWMGFIGLFLQGAINGELQAQATRDLLAGRTVGQVMSRSFTALPGYLTVRQVVDAHILGSGQRLFVVTDNDRPVGLFSVESARRVPPSEWAATTLEQAMTRIEGPASVTPDTALWSALLQMEINGLSSLPVMQDGRLLGLLRREDVMGFLVTLNTLDPQLARS